MLPYLLVALVLRPQVLGVGPLLPAIRLDVTMGHSTAGLLSSIPLACMGIGALVMPAVARYVDVRRGLAATVAMLAVIGGLRALSPNIELLFAMTIAIGLLIGLGSSFLPVSVKAEFPNRPAMATGACAAGLQIGATFAALGAVPLATLAGGWRASLAAMALLTAPAVLLWTWHIHRVDPRQPHPPSVDAAGATGTPNSAYLALMFGLQTLPYYAINAWLPSYLIEEGWSGSSAGFALGFHNLGGLLANLTILRLADRVGTRRTWLTGMATVAATGIMSLSLLPNSTWFVAPIVGVALGTLFGICLLLPLDSTDTAIQVRSATSKMLFGGYVLASTGPYILGAVRDITPTLRASLLLLPLFLVALIGVAAMAYHGSARLSTNDLK